MARTNPIPSASSTLGQRRTDPLDCQRDAAVEKLAIAEKSTALAECQALKTGLEEARKAITKLESNVTTNTQDIKANSDSITGATSTLSTLNRSIVDSSLDIAHIVEDIKVAKDDVSLYGAMIESHGLTLSDQRDAFNRVQATILTAGSSADQYNGHMKSVRDECQQLKQDLSASRDKELESFEGHLFVAAHNMINEGMADAHQQIAAECQRLVPLELGQLEFEVQFMENRFVGLGHGIALLDEQGGLQDDLLQLRQAHVSSLDGAINSLSKTHRDLRSQLLAKPVSTVNSGTAKSPAPSAPGSVGFPSVRSSSSTRAILPLASSSQASRSHTPVDTWVPPARAPSRPPLPSSGSVSSQVSNPAQAPTVAATGAATAAIASTAAPTAPVPPPAPAAAVANSPSSDDQFISLRPEPAFMPHGRRQWLIDFTTKHACLAHAYMEVLEKIATINLARPADMKGIPAVRGSWNKGMTDIVPLADIDQYGPVGRATRSDLDRRWDEMIAQTGPTVDGIKEIGKAVVGRDNGPVTDTMRAASWSWIIDKLHWAATAPRVPKTIYVALAVIEADRKKAGIKSTKPFDPTNPATWV